MPMKAFRMMLPPPCFTWVFVGVQPNVALLFIFALFRPENVALGFLVASLNNPLNVFGVFTTSEVDS